MSSKRKESPAEMTGRERKKQKMTLARTIAVQSATPGASRSNTPTTSQPQTPNAVAGPSKSVKFDNAKPLPGSLDVEKFAEARAFEINAMHNAMLTARDNATHRAWQQLPRHLRRRAASHDVRRVPVRLREKAKAEMDAAPRKNKVLPKRGKAKRLSRTETLLKRQKDKTWLETHLWHAKRMKMENMWGYRLAVQPTEKAFRPSHRAAVHGSILHDASYYGFIELKGPEEVLKTILDSCCDAAGPSPGAKRFLTGARAYNTRFYKRGAYPIDLIAPVTVIWQPAATAPVVPTPSPPTSDAPSTSKRKRKSKSKSKSGETGSENTSTHRILWLKVHPSVFHEVYVELRDAACFALDAVKKAAKPEDPECTVEMADLRNKLNVFEIMGPKSSQVIRGALKPVAEDAREDFRKFWDALSDLQTTASLPRNMVIGMKVYDPRLSFPPKNAKVYLDGTDPSPRAPTASIFPTSVLAQTEIWDENVRNPLQKPRYKKKDLDERRSKNAIPGTPLQAIRKDDRIPIILIQRSVESPAATFENRSADSPTLHGWTMILPAGWAMPFFESLTYTGTRVAGQRERASQHFGASRPNFPTDYPTTQAYEYYAEDREEEEMDRWNRKPPAKRVNYKKLGIRSPWRADWEVVLGLKSAESETQGDTELMDESDDFVPAQREEGAIETEPERERREMSLGTAARQDSEEGRDPNHPRPWLLQGPAVSAALEAASSMFIHSSGLLQHLNSLRAKRSLAPLAPNFRAEDIWKTGLVMIRLRMCGRGKPEDLGLIYRLTDEEWQRVVTMERERKQGAIVDEDIEEGKVSNATPPESSVIGYITTGNFSLSLGEGYAIGCVPISELFDIREQGRRFGGDDLLLVKTRNRDGLIYRPAYLDVLDG